MKFDSKQLTEMSNAVRAAGVSAVRSAQSGHIGIVLGGADIVTTIFANYLRRGVDEFVLSAGHGSALLYSILKLVGYKIPSLKNFRKFGGLPGHPELGTPGVAATTGPLGQGLANAVGISLAKKIKLARGDKTADGFVYCLCSDGDLMEGVAQEAIGFAGIYKLNNLILFWDDNSISIDGRALTDVNIPARMRAAGFDVLSVNGSDFEEINYAIATAQKANKPVFIQCKTIAGLGSSVAGTAAAHALGVDDAELAALEAKFASDAGIRLWEKVANRTAVTPNRHTVAKISIDLPDVKPGDVSTRELSGRVLEKLVVAEPLLLGGSADLATSTNTKTPAHRDITPNDFSGDFINYGVREHAMAAIMNGLCYAGFRPYGGTFLVFSDYMRPAIRLAALSKLSTIFVFSHDSVAVGEDGPTHQPVEHLGSLRLIPNLNVFRPCNLVEVAASWEMALGEVARPSCIILSRQKFAQIQTPDIEKIKMGAYIIKTAKTRRPRVTLIATGAEVPLAVTVAEKIPSAQVVSMPSVEKFRDCPDDYKQKILTGYVVAIEAGRSTTWFEFADAVMGIDEFGESGSGAEVYKHFGFDAGTISDAIIKKLK